MVIAMTIVSVSYSVLHSQLELHFLLLHLIIFSLVRNLLTFVVFFFFFFLNENANNCRRSPPLDVSTHTIKQKKAVVVVVGEKGTMFH